jgi:IclR family acetate operon transcriptional repressor
VTTRKLIRSSEDDETQKRRKPTAVTGLQIVEYLAKHPRGARLGDIAAAVQMDAGQTHRMVAALVSDGWVISVSENGTYSLAARAIGIGATYVERLDLIDHAMPFMDELFRVIGESVFLGELRGDAVVCVGRRLSDRTLTVWTDVGKSWPLIGTAVGTAVLSARVARLGPNAGIDMSEDISQALKLGYGRDYGHYRAGVESIAAPVLNSVGEEIGAISVAGPEARLGAKEIHENGLLVRDAAASISERLGCINYNFPPAKIAIPIRSRRSRR